MHGNKGCKSGTLNFRGPCAPTHRFVVLRDPLERFVSAYIDKCIKRRREGHCEPKVVMGDTSLEDELTPAQRFEAFVDTFPLKWNLHFLPQHMICNLKDNLADYDVLVMNTSFYKQLSALQDRVPSLADAIEEVFSVEEKFLIKNTGTETHASLLVQKFLTPRIAKRLFEIYAEDYKALSLPIPEWLVTMLSRA